VARLGGAGQAGLGWAWRGEAWRGVAGEAWLGVARRGVAGRGVAWRRICLDCGRLIFSFPPGSAAWSGNRCGMCLTIPDWFLDPKLVDAEPQR